MLLLERPLAAVTSNHQDQPAEQAGHGKRRRETKGALGAGRSCAGKTELPLLSEFRRKGAFVGHCETAKDDEEES